jgi:hypothetical protein
MEKKIIAFPIALILTFLAATLLFYSKERFFCGQFEDDTGFFASELDRYQKRDTSIPSIIVTGGSDVREAWNVEVAKNFFRQKGINFFLLAHSSSGNAIEEQVQIISYLNLTKNDLVMMNISAVDMIDGSPPHLSSFSENLQGYRWIIKSKNYQTSSFEEIRLYLADYIPYYRERLLARKFFALKRWKFNSKIAEKHFYGSSPQPEKEFRRKMDFAISHKIGENANLLVFDQHSKLISILGENLKNNIVFVKTPRNPLYQSIISDSFKKIAKDYSSSLQLIDLADGINLNSSDYYDFNHFHSSGRNKFMQIALLKSAYLFKDRIKND